MALLARIERAEGMLRRASAIEGIGSSTDTDQRRESLLPRFSRMERIAAVLDVAIDAERPTIRRARRLVRNVTLAAAGSGAGLSDVLQDAFRGIRKITMLELYGKAYRLDLKHYLATKEKVTKTDWEGWDTLLGEGCNQLAEIRSVQYHCLPKE